MKKTTSISYPMQFFLASLLFLTSFLYLLNIHMQQYQYRGNYTTYADMLRGTVIGTNLDPTNNSYSRDEGNRGASISLGSGAKCVTFDENMDDIIASSSMIVVSGPSKAAITSMKKFTEKCTGLQSNSLDGRINNSIMSHNIPENFLLVEGEDTDVPGQVLSFHSENGDVLPGLIENMPRDALIVYSYREETERLLSAIHHVLEINCRSKDNITPSVNNGTHCIYDELYVVNDVIEPKIYEIGRGAPEIMTCDFYDAIERNFPRMLFMNFKQMDHLQKVIARYHCPDETPKRVNVAVDRKEKRQNLILLRLQKDGGLIESNEWLKKKRSMLEWRLNLKGREKQCQGKTRRMEDELYACRDELLQITRDTSF